MEDPLEASLHLYPRPGRRLSTATSFEQQDIVLVGYSHAGYALHRCPRSPVPLNRTSMEPQELLGSITPWPCWRSIETS